MQRLFAPWRYAYVSGASAAPGCVLCQAAGGESETLTLCHGARAFALLNRFPYTSGHAMVAPFEHVADFTALDPATMADLMEVAQRVVRGLESLYHPHGFNLGMNLGESAGAGIADHLHLHIVPRWRGDTNFMTVAGEVRVLPEDLPTTWARLREVLDGRHD
ncbi:MAG TPA: HIT domain-containing protein [Thermoanaerobaculaceae bacterium]|nr:HIT domain-containing protein [Thermoanaerobaculaceae bacterium]HPS79270.1 HIT domain-containing protein [Thermoanaerobaculaceae bacterium]